jgi:hypothetical protein
MTRSHIPVQAFERISASKTTSSSVRLTQNNAFAAKSDISYCDETQLSIQDTAETVTVSSAEVKQPDLLKKTVQEDRVVENASPPQPEYIFVKQKEAGDSQLVPEFGTEASKPAEDVQSEWETIQTERKEFDYAGFAPEPFCLKDEFVVHLSEQESVTSLAPSIEETPAQTPKANLLPSYNAGHELRQSTMLRRPILAGTGLTVLLVSLVIGVLLNEKFQHSASQPSTAAAPVRESAPLPKSDEPTLSASRNTAITEESDVADLEKNTSAKFEKPVPPASFRGNKRQPPEEKNANKTKTKQDTLSNKKLVPKENVNKTKAKQNTSLTKNLVPKKQISVPTKPAVFTRPRIVGKDSVSRKN